MKNAIFPVSQGLRLLAIGSSRHNGDWNFGPVCSSFMRIYYVFEGSARVEIGDDVHTLLPGHLYLIPPYATHTDRCDGPFAHYYIHMADRSQQLLRWLSAYDVPFSIPATDFDRHVIDHLAQLCSGMQLTDLQPTAYETDANLRSVERRYDSLSLAERTEAGALLLVLLSRFSQSSQLRPPISDERIERTLRTIEQQIRTPLSIDRLVADANLGKERFIRLFKQVVGETPALYIAKQKILQAQIMLATTNLRIKEVAFALGFESESYFDRVFLRHVHLSPTAFRQQNLSPTPI